MRHSGRQIKTTQAELRYTNLLSDIFRFLKSERPPGPRTRELSVRLVSLLACIACLLWARCNVSKAYHRSSISLTLYPILHDSGLDSRTSKLFILDSVISLKQLLFSFGFWYIGFRWKKRISTSNIVVGVLSTTASNTWKVDLCTFSYHNIKHHGKYPLAGYLSDGVEKTDTCRRPEHGPC